MARSLPKFSSLDSSYPAEIHPCDQGWDNQCAIRMSICLIGAGFHLSGYKQGPLCKHGHARGAQSLGDYIWSQVRRPTIVPGGANARVKVNNKSGVVFFKDIAGFRNGIGDHIDLWDGKASKTGDYFEDCTEIWFWPAS